MAEGGEEGSWWGGWLQVAKDKSAAAIDFVRKDLEEFKTVVTEDTTNVYNAIGSKMTKENASTTLKKVKEGGQSLLGTIAKSLTIPPDEDDDKGIAITADGVYDRKKARLRAIQMDPGTYLEPPEELDEYDKWEENFDMEAKKGDISELLVSHTDIRSLYTQMVPSSVSHADFWKRYFYKVHLQELRDKTRDKILERATEWEEEDLDWDDVEGPSSPPNASHMEMAAAALAKEKQEQMTEEQQQQQSTSDLEGLETIPAAAVPPENRSAVAPVASVIEKELDNEQQIKDSEKSDTEGDTETQANMAATSIPSQVPSEFDVVPTQTDPVPTLLPTSSNTAEVTRPLEIQIDSHSSGMESPEELKTREKGDMVVVGSNGATPSSGSLSSNPKDVASLDDDWEKEFDIEVTEEDIRLAQMAASKKIAEKDAKVDEDDAHSDDWESWD